MASSAPPIAGAIASVILGAGASRRMQGRDKLLEPVAGEPILHRLARFAIVAGGPVAVTLPPDAPARRAALEGLALTQLAVLGAEEGIAASLRQAAAWAIRLKAQGLLICPGDMPELAAEDFIALKAAFAESPLQPIRAAAQDRPGHPVIVPARLLPQFERLRGDEGARSLLGQFPPRLLCLPDRRAILDLDTLQDWENWRAAQEDCLPSGHS